MKLPEGYGFGGKIPTPPHDGALELAEAIVSLVRSAERLDAAKERVPDYTGQWEREDYFANEQNDYNVAANELLALLK